MGIPETGKAAKSIDGALEHILRQRKLIARTESERASTDWVLMYVAGMADCMVHAPLADRERFAREINDVIREMGIVPLDADPRTVIRPAGFTAPLAEGDWQLDENIHVGED
jgi:hypothetical protein